MKVKIKQFRNLVGLEFTAPASIYGKNGKGKSNCINAVLWVLSEKNTENEEVIPFGLNEAEVSVEVDGITFGRKIEFKKVRKQGEVEEKITGTTSTYFINGEVLNKTTYFMQVKALLGAIQYAEPLYFFSQKTADKLEIINQIVGLPKPTVNLQELKRGVATAKKEVDIKIAIIENLKSKKVDVTELQTKISEKEAEIEKLKKQIVNKNPEIEAFNDKINAEIIACQNSTCQILTKKQLRDVSEVERQLAELQPIVVEVPELIRKERPNLLPMPKEPTKPQQVDVDGICPTCGNKFKGSPYEKAIKREGEIELNAEYERQMNAWLADCENVERVNKHNFEMWQNTNKANEEAFELAQQNFEKAQEFNSQIPARRSELEALRNEIIEQNKEIEAENLQIEAKNKQLLTDFEAEKQKNILALKNQIKVQDYSTTNEAILQQIAEIEQSKRVFSDELAVLNSITQNIITETALLNQARQVLINIEKKLIEAQNEWQLWRSSFDKKCLLLFDGKVKITTTRETYSDTIEDCFEVYFNRNNEWVEFQYLNHSDQLLCAVEVSKVLCEKFSCKIPLLIDNAEAINEDRRPTNCLLAIVSETIEFQIK
jgi:predicted nuclease with TOPRIM domain